MRSDASSIAADSASKSVTSTAYARPSISFATASAWSAFTSSTATCAPSAAIRRHVSAPMPEPPPVTTARCPFRSPIGETVTVALSWRAHSGAWLSLAEHLHDAQGVGGSNPSAPTPKAGAAKWYRPRSPRSYAESRPRRRLKARPDEPMIRRGTEWRMFSDGSIHQLPDVDPQETGEWLESLDAVIAVKGKPRAHYLLARLMERARDKGALVPAMVTTDYINTITPEQEPWFPGNEDIERRICAFIRWNAVAMVDRANHRFDGLGGHLSTYASAASLYEVGFNHFFRGKGDGGFGDQIYFQGHAAPGIYARAFLEGRLTEDQLDHFRRETGGRGLPSYPHPRRLPTFWEYPTVSMGLGPLNAVYQARFNRYLYNRKLVDTSNARVWCFVGDGELDEPEATAALDLAARERLDNLIFVVNCNLQRLDGPVRGNGKVIQEFESTFRGMGWNVIKVIWGRQWDDLLARDVDGVLVNTMNTTLDGDFQKYAVESGAYIREHFFGPDPRLRKMVEHLSDDDLQKLPRGGHDYRKLYAAYKTAVEHEGAPTVILAKTIKGWTLGPTIEARNATHQIKKMSKQELLTLRDRLYLQDQIPEEALDEKMPPYYRPSEDSEEYQYLMERRTALDGSLPRRVVRNKPVKLPNDKAFSEFQDGSGKQSPSTTMAFGRLLRNLLRDENIGVRVVPIIP